MREPGETSSEKEASPEPLSKGPPDLLRSNGLNGVFSQMGSRFSLLLSFFAKRKKDRVCPSN